MRYWKANKATSEAIIEHLSDWTRVKEQALRLSRRCGGSRRRVYTSKVFGEMRVSGFIFADDSRVDRKMFVRLKGTDDGWRPRRNKSDLSKEFYSLRSDCLNRIMDVIGMKLFGNGDLSSSTPGVKVVGETVYLETSDDVEAEGCRRISDLTYEKAVAKKA